MKIRIHQIIKFVIGLFCAISFVPTTAIAQMPDSLERKTGPALSHTDSLAVYYYAASLDSLIDKRIYPIDSSLTYFHQYKSIQHKNQMNSDLGSHGHAIFHRVFQPATKLSFQMNTPAYAPYLIYGDRVNYYRLIRPFTELGYLSGLSKEQNLDVIFSRGLSSQILVGLQLNIRNVPGALQQQLANHNKSYFTFQYQTRNKRYGINAQYFHNKLSIQENGGLAYDSIFVQRLETDSKVIPVQLTTAENRIRVSGFEIEQYFNLTKPDTLHHGFDPGHITYQFQYLRSEEVYEDQEINNVFYENFSMVFDSVATYDSTFQSRISNRFQWSNRGYNPLPVSKVFYLYGGIQIDFIRQHLAYNSLDKSYQSTMPYGGLRLILFKRSILNTRFKYTIGGYHGGDFSLHNSLKQYLGSADKNVGMLLIKLDLVNRMPAWYYSYFHSNRFNWNQILSKEHLVNLDAAYHYHQFTLGAKLSTIQSYTYLNDSAKVVQLNSTGSIVQLYTEGNFMLRHIGINFRFVHQTSSMHNSIHLPKLSGKLNLYYSNWVFKKAAQLQTGFQFYYYTAYYADAYMPELRMFTLQSEKMIGDYLFVDAYATLKVKRLRFCVMANNLLGYFGQARYFDSPHYPALEPGILLRLIWRFHN
jgi:hypothetical protein